MTDFLDALSNASLVACSACLAIVAFSYSESASSDLDKLARARTVSLSDLSSLVTDEFVIVRGFVQSKFWLNYLNLKSSTGVPCVILKEIVAKTVSIELTSLGWIFDIPNPYVSHTYCRSFILAGVEPKNTSSHSECQVIVDFEDPSTELFSHVFALTTVFSGLKFDFTTCYTLLKSLFGIRRIPHPPELPLPAPTESVLIEEILPVGQVITVIGICSPPSQVSAFQGFPFSVLGMTKDIIKINRCPGFRYFVSEMTKDEMMEELTRKSDKLFWSGVVLGSLSVGLLGYVILKWKRKLQDGQSR